MPQKCSHLSLEGTRRHMGEIILAPVKPIIYYLYSLPPSCMSLSARLRGGYPLRKICGPPSG